MDQHEAMSLKLKPPASLSEQVAEVLHEEIKTGNYRPGERLPTEANLAESFGVSRTVIREALARLKFDGILDSRQGQGAVVAQAGDRKVFRIEDLGNASQTRLAYLFELRAILEGDAAALAAKRRSEDQLSSMERRLQEMEEAVREDIDGTDPDMAFHQLLADSSRNPFLIELMEFLNAKLREVIQTAREHSSQYPGWPDSVQLEHEAIFKAIRAQEEAAAREAMLEHIKNAGERLGLAIY
jgi:GntR family transcriptional repressor for pyruvate dehydrogenase complex